MVSIIKQMEVIGRWAVLRGKKKKLNFVYIGCCWSHDAQAFPFSTTSLHKSCYENPTLALVCFSSEQYDVLFKNYMSQYFFFPSETNPSDDSHKNIYMNAT